MLPSGHRKKKKKVENLYRGGKRGEELLPEHSFVAAQCLTLAPEPPGERGKGEGKGGDCSNGVFKTGEGKRKREGGG